MDSADSNVGTRALSAKVRLTPLALQDMFQRSSPLNRWSSSLRRGRGAATPPTKSPSPARRHCRGGSSTCRAASGSWTRRPTRSVGYSAVHDAEPLLGQPKDGVAAAADDARHARAAPGADPVGAAAAAVPGWVNLVRALGCRYVWIDSLCIVQDDGEDWVEESANMSDIYNKAALNIAATLTRSALAGLFQYMTHEQGFRRLRKSADRGDGGGGGGADYSAVPSLETIKDGEVDGRAVFARISHDRSHEVLYGDLDFHTPMEPLLSRAWVFQEILLSRRTLHFGASEVLWECRTGCYCECTRITNAHGLSVRDINSTQASSGLETGGGVTGGSDAVDRFVQTKKVLFSDGARARATPGRLSTFGSALVRNTRSCS